jgi:hypothetical protein
MNKKSRTNVLTVRTVLRTKMKWNHISMASIFAGILGHVQHFLVTLMHFRIILKSQTRQTHVDIVARIFHALGPDSEYRWQQMKTGKCG